MARVELNFGLVLALRALLTLSAISVSAGGTLLPLMPLPTQQNGPGPRLLGKEHFPGARNSGVHFVVD